LAERFVARSAVRSAVRSAERSVDVLGWLGVDPGEVVGAAE